MAAPLTEAAIQKVRHLIAAGELVPGQRLPPEPELAESLGTSRSTVREAVRALVTARVLDVRRGDGTFVTSLRPELLLAGIGAAADLLQGGFTLELLEVRRILEPAATAMAATRDQRRHPDRARCVLTSDVCGRHRRRSWCSIDEEFHQLVAATAGNATLASMLTGVSSRTTRGRAWRGIVEGGATERTIAEHAAILSAFRARDPQLAEAAALVHVATTEAWFRSVLQAEDDELVSWKAVPPGDSG